LTPSLSSKIAPFSSVLSEFLSPLFPSTLRRFLNMFFRLPFSLLTSRTRSSFSKAPSYNLELISGSWIFPRGLPPLVLLSDCPVLPSTALGLFSASFEKTRFDKIILSRPRPSLFPFSLSQTFLLPRTFLSNFFFSPHLSVSFGAWKQCGLFFTPPIHECYAPPTIALPPKLSLFSQGLLTRCYFEAHFGRSSRAMPSLFPLSCFARFRVF